MEKKHYSIKNSNHSFLQFIKDFLYSVKNQLDNRTMDSVNDSLDNFVRCINTYGHCLDKISVIFDNDPELVQVKELLSKKLLIKK